MMIGDMDPALSTLLAVAIGWLLRDVSDWRGRRRAARATAGALAYDLSDAMATVEACGARERIDLPVEFFERPLELWRDGTRRERLRDALDRETWTEIEGAFEAFSELLIIRRRDEQAGVLERLSESALALIVSCSREIPQAQDVLEQLDSTWRESMTRGLGKAARVLAVRRRGSSEISIK